MRSTRALRANSLAHQAAWLQKRSTQGARPSLLQASRGLTTQLTEHRSAPDVGAALARRRTWIEGYPHGTDPSGHGTPAVTPSPGDAPASATPEIVPDAAADTAIERAQPAPDATSAAGLDGEIKAHSAPSPAQQRADKMVHDALTARGIRYRWGGTSRGGFDCSGFTRYVMARDLGIKLPHSAHAQAHYGQKVAFGDLREGDLVFFRTYTRGISHVGIYVGNNRFIHAPRAGRSVSVEPLTGYYRRRFVTARRLTGAGPPG